MSSWQPIETAPIQPFKPDSWYMAHSPYFLGWNGHNVSIVSYRFTQKGKGKWHSNGRIVEGLTHWMPLPEGPSLETSPEPGMHRNQVIARARMAHGGKWPAELTSGVMFYEGMRVTREDFEHR